MYEASEVTAILGGSIGIVASEISAAFGSVLAFDAGAYYYAQLYPRSFQYAIYPSAARDVVTMMGQSLTIAAIGGCTYMLFNKLQNKIREIRYNRATKQSNLKTIESLLEILNFEKGFSAGQEQKNR